jgi:hypothetical protein
MKKVWKWIIGIVLGLLVLAILVGVGFAFRSGYIGACNVRARDGSGPTITREFGTPYGGMHRGFGMVPFTGMQRGYGMMAFGGLLGGLFRLGLLALVVVGIVWLVRRLRQPTAAAVPATPIAPLASCGKCGKTVETDWKNCPYCGKKL